MIHRLVWNFEFTTAKGWDISQLQEKKEENLKWEARFFWAEEEIIRFALIDTALLELVNYQHKQKKDYYYVLPDKEYNIKRRRDELLYKPLIKKTKHVSGFGSKVNLGELSKTPDVENCIIDAPVIIEQLTLNSIEVLVKKESFTYKFPVQPQIKLELSRIEINHHIYFSACVEGKSRDLVEKISKHLVSKKTSSDYISFLKKRIKIQ
jgi:hypothetical protein